MRPSRIRRISPSVSTTSTFSRPINSPPVHRLVNFTKTKMLIHCFVKFPTLQSIIKFRRIYPKTFLCTLHVQELTVARLSIYHTHTHTQHTSRLEYANSYQTHFSVLASTYIRFIAIHIRYPIWTII